MNLALFDFDGTITTRETFADFMHFAVTRRRLAVGRVVLAPVVIGYWCREHGLALICSELEVADGRLTGRYRGKQCVGPEKPRRVLDRYDLGDFAEVYAYGDTHEDLDLLAIASRKYFGWQPVA